MDLVFGYDLQPSTPFIIHIPKPVRTQPALWRLQPVGELALYCGRMLLLTMLGCLLTPMQVPQADEIAKLENAVRADPTNAAAWKSLGVAMVGRRKPESALAAFVRACDLDPKDEDACYFLGRQLTSLSRYQEAVPAFEKAVLAAPKEKLTRTHRAAALNQIGNGSLEEAERHFREAVGPGRGPDQMRAEAATDYGAFLFRQARTTESLETLQRAVQIDPSLARAYTELGRVRLHANLFSEAVAALERAMKLDGGLPGTRMLLGRAYLAVGRTEEGERQLRLGRKQWDETQGRPPVR